MFNKDFLIKEVFSMDNLVEITWVDSKSYSNEWLGLDEIKNFKLEACSTGGYIIHEDDVTYFIAQTKGEQGFYNIFLIPKGCVRWVREKQ